MAQAARTCACEASACEPGVGVLEAAAPSAHCSTRLPSTAAPSTPSWSSAPCEPRALPRRRRLSPRVHHITASRTTPAHTHPRSTHLHLHRTHLPLTSPPATRSPLPLHRPCPSSHVSHACAQPSQDKTFSSPTAVGETPGSSYQLHEDNNASAAAGQGATHDEPLAVRAITALHECERNHCTSASQAPAGRAHYGALFPQGDAYGHRAMIAPASPRPVRRLRCQGMPVATTA